MTAEPDDLPAAPPGDDEPMPQIPGYRLLRVLGHGGMSTVYLAEQESLGRQVAVKVMLPEALADEVSRRRFENEARTVARLEHPHIVGIFAVGRTVDDLPYYAMPCLPRGHLGQRRFHEDPDGEATIAAILRALLSALDYAHARGVVHRDVKAENVLFDDAGRPLLADFGIALRKGLGPRVTTAGLAVGSTAYMAPEQARGEEVDGRADLYSVGVLAWEMLTGQLPYMAGDALSMAVMHAQDPVPKLPPGLRHWQRFIDKAMAKSPGHRFRDAGQMLEALERIRQRRPVPGAAALRRLGRRIGPPQRWPRWAWGTLVLVAAAAVGLALRQAGPGEADFFRATPAAAVVEDAQPAAAGDGPPAPAEPAPSPAQTLLDAAAEQVAQRNLTLPEGGNAYDSVLAAHQADPEHPQLAETADAVIAALGAELARHLRGGNQRRAADYHERAATLAERTGRGDGPAMRKLRAEALAALEARIADAARRFDRGGAQALARQAGDYGADAAAVARLRARADAILQPGDRVPGDPAGAVLVRAGNGLFAAAPREVSRADYGRFAAATGRPASLCRERISPLRIVAPRSWTAPGFPQGQSEPVVCVSWADADAYARWFSQRSGHRYRLPTPAEWQALSGIAAGSPRAVAEWLQSCSGPGCRQRIVAGGSWRNSTGSESRDADRGYDDVGFRLVRDL
ncbi:MAG: protein kinase domain-containing protein [Gammaproteobacteria bacterium]